MKHSKSAAIVYQEMESVGTIPLITGYLSFVTSHKAQMPANHKAQIWQRVTANLVSLRWV